MIATVLLHAGVVITAGLCAIAVWAVGSVAYRLHLSFVTRKRLDALEATYRSAFSWPIGHEDRPFPTVARALTVSSREMCRGRLALWVEPALQQMRENVRAQPRYVAGICESIDGLLRTVIDEESSREADILEFADRIRDDVRASRDETISRHGRVYALLDDPRYEAFVLDGPKRRLRMLANAFRADMPLCDVSPEAVFRHLAVQSSVVTECALEATRRTAGWPFLMEAWESVLSRLSVAQRTFHVVSAWAGLLPPEDPRTDAKGNLARLREITRQLALVAGACAAEGAAMGGTSRLEDLFWKCEASHRALRNVEILLRNAITRLDTATRATARHVVH